jgi:hypothetical protein
MKTEVAFEQYPSSRQQIVARSLRNRQIAASLIGGNRALPHPDYRDADMGCPGTR